MSSNIDGIPIEVKPIIKEFTDIFYDELQRGLPPLRNFEHQIYLVPGVA